MTIDLVNVILTVIVNFISNTVLNGEIRLNAKANAGYIVGYAKGVHLGTGSERLCGDFGSLNGGDGRGGRRIGTEGGEGLVFAVAVFRAIFHEAAHVVNRVGFQVGQQADVRLRSFVALHDVIVDGGLLRFAPAYANFNHQTEIVGSDFRAARGGAA